MACLCFDAKGKRPTLPNTMAKAPRTLKYAWALGLTALMFAGVVLDRGSPLLPIIQHAIELMRQNAPPTTEP